jgi:hypothetical protein
VNDVLASEFRFFQEAPEAQRSEAERLASLIGNIGESSEDVQLACLVVFLFARDVEGREDLVVMRMLNWPAHQGPRGLRSNPDYSPQRHREHRGRNWKSLWIRYWHHPAGGAMRFAPQRRSSHGIIVVLCVLCVSVVNNPG